MKKSIPREFSRKTRSLAKFLLWKATEFRTFLLYTGPVVLKNKLSRQKYYHVLKLHVAMRLLLNPYTCQTQNRVALGFLRQYDRDCQKLYGKEYMSFNVHSLINLANDAMLYGHLNRVSALPYENKLGHLKRW